MSNLIISNKKKTLSLTILSILLGSHSYADSITINDGSEHTFVSNSYDTVSVTDGGLVINGAPSDITKVENTNPLVNSGLIYIAGPNSETNVKTSLDLHLQNSNDRDRGGIVVRQGGQLTVGGNTKIDLDPSTSSVAESVHGVVVSGEGSKATFNGDIQISNESAMNVGSRYHSGIHVNYGGEVVTEGNIDIKSYNANGELESTGLFVGYGNPSSSPSWDAEGSFSETAPISRFTMDKNKTLTIEVDGKFSGGVMTNGNAVVDLGKVNITTKGDWLSYGLQAGNNSKITFAGGTITTNGSDNAHALIADSAFSNNDSFRSTITATNLVSASTHGYTSSAALASNYGDITFEGGAKLSTTNRDANAIGIINHSSVTVAQGLTIQTEGPGSYGLYLEGDDVLFNGGGINSGATITTVDSAIKFNKVDTTGASAILNNTAVKSTGSNVAIAVDTGGATKLLTNQLDLTNSSISSSSNKLLEVTGGNSANYSNFTLNANKSQLTGTTALTGSNIINLNLTNKSIWNITDDSTVTRLTNEHSTVNFTSSSGYSQLTIDKDLAGNGDYGVRINLVDSTGDKIIVKGDATGSHRLKIANDAAQSTDGLGHVDIVTVYGNDTSRFTGNYTELGGYLYQPVNTRNAGVSTWGLRGTKILTSSASAAMNFQNSTYLLSYIDTQTLMQRMGDIRDTPEHDGNFWMRSFGGKLNSFSGSGAEGFDMNYYGLQMGADKLVVDNSIGRFYAGAMMGYTYGDPDYSNGSGTVKDYNVGLYGTLITNSGMYIDTLVKYMHARNKFDVKDTLGQSVSGTANSDGYSASVELGKKFHLNSPFYVEPQVQLSYHYQQAAKTHASNGLKVKLDSYESILGRTGGLVGYDWQVDGQAMNTYLKVGYVRELSGNTSYSLNGNREKHDFGGGWVETGLGVSAQLKRHSLYGEVSYANGNRFDKQQVNLGYRYQF